METTIDAQTTSHQAFTILQRSVCLTLSCHYLGNTRHVSLDDLDLMKVDAPGSEATAQVEVATDKEQLHLTKRLVNAKTLRAAMRVIWQAKSFLRSTAIPGHRIFGERSYLVPLALVEDVERRLLNLRAELLVEAQAIADRWAFIVAEQAASLGDLFDATQYPTAEDVIAAFGLDWDWVSFAAPERLETVDSVLYEQAKARHENRMSDAYDEVVLALRSEALGIMNDLVNRLTPGDDGKPKVLRGTALRDLEGYLALLPKRDLTDDAPLRDAVARVRSLADGLGIDALRSDDGLRAQLRDEAGKAATALSELVISGRRAISFDGTF